MIDKILACFMITVAIVIVSILTFVGVYGILCACGVSSYTAFRVAYVAGVAAIAICSVGTVLRW